MKRFIGILMVVAIMGLMIGLSPPVIGTWTVSSNEAVYVMTAGNETYPEDMEAILKKDKLIWINGAGYGYKTSGRYEFVPIPPQDVSAMFVWVEGEDGIDEWEFIGEYEDLTFYFDAGDLPKSQHIGILKAVNPALAKPATVTRRYLGLNYDIQCLVSQSAVDMWQTGDLQVGDYVIVSFITETPGTEERDIAILVDKVYPSW